MTTDIVLCNKEVIHASKLMSLEQNPNEFQELKYNIFFCFGGLSIS